MDKVLCNMSTFNHIPENILFLKENIYQPIFDEFIDWCNKNLTDYVILSIHDSCFMDDGLTREKHFATVVDCVNYMSNYLVIPVLKFVEESDMMAFKLRWMDTISLQFRN